MAFSIGTSATVFEVDSLIISDRAGNQIQLSANDMRNLGFQTSTQLSTMAMTVVPSDSRSFAGGNQNDRLDGSDGNDLMWGNVGNDTLRGGLGNDEMWGGSSSPSDDETGNDFLYGDAGDDRLEGENGNDTLDGGPGADRLSGGAGADRFMFGSLLTSGDKDVIVDFLPGTDKLVFGSGFTTVAVFTTSAPTTGSPAFIYDRMSGLLRYDPDGNGALAAIEIAMINGAPALTATDFVFA